MSDERTIVELYVSTTVWVETYIYQNNFPTISANDVLQFLLSRLTHFLCRLALYANNHNWSWYT